MKKLIFAALLATVAVGSAYAQQYVSSPGATSPAFSCQGADDPKCTYPIYSVGSTLAIPPSDPVYSQTRDN